MTPVIPSPVSNITLIPGPAFSTRSFAPKRYTASKKQGTSNLTTKGCFLPLLTSTKVFPNVAHITCCRNRARRVSATGTDVAVEEQDSPAVDDISSGTSESSSGVVEASDESSSTVDTSKVGQVKRARSSWKSEMPPIRNEDLVPGATFTGKVKSIQPFGAFVDFGAFTDGLVHVSQLSDRFVKEVGSVVSIGQEVKVKLLEVNQETGRISLTMREGDDANKQQQQRDSGSNTEKSRPPRKSNTTQGQRRDKSSPFAKGQDLKGTVKNLTRSGAFITLPEGEEGFLPSAEESDGGISNIMGSSTLQVGQEVDVRVLRIARGQVTLTMKKEEDSQELDPRLSQGIVYTASNPFALAFRSNKEIASFLNDRNVLEKPVTTIPSGDKSSSESTDFATESLAAKSSESSAEEIIKGDDEKGIGILESSVEIADHFSSSENHASTEVIKAESSVAVTEEPIKDELVPEAVAADEEKSIEIPDSPAETANELSSAESSINSLSSLSESVDIASVSLAPESDAVSKSLAMESSESSTESVVQEVFTADEEKSIEVPKYSAETIDRISSSETESGGVVTEEIIKDEVIPEAIAADQEKTVEIPDSPSEITNELSSAEISISSLSSLSESVDIASESLSEESDAVSQSLAIESSESTESVAQEVVPADEEKPIEVPEASAETTDPILSSESPVISEVVESVLETIAKDKVAAVTQDIVSTPPADSSITESDDQTGDVDDVVMDSQVGNAEREVLEPVDAIDASISATMPAETEKIEVVADHSEGNGNVPTPSVTSDQANPESSKKVTAGISPVLVKQLREETGAGMMDCKKALAESNGDIVKAQEFLRKKGLASAEKRAARATAEGRIGSYIHDSRIGVLVEVNCETDFVSRGDIFKELVEDLAMQVAACPQVQYLVPEDVPDDIVAKEREIEMQKEDLLLKPEPIRSKIVDGRINKRLQELALLEQPYIKNDKVIVKDWVKQTISTVGENIKVKRFVRLNLGEGLEKKSQDFAAEVVAQTKAKSDPPPKKEEPGTSLATETIEKPPTVAVSATLVKQLREETGAGMMDCKKALSETGGDLEKAQEYLRKKGLSTADKKSSRLAAEGRVGCYIHDSRIGVLIEVNSETDFVGRSEKFKELVDDLAMQVVACPQVKYVSIKDIPEDILKKEKDLEMQREDLQSKPENIREKIVEGRVSKRLGELALLEQPFIKDDSLLVKDLVKQTVATLGENIKVRRFIRFTLGETADSAKPEE
ncbi:hypothetical protein MLD38_005709 [Melastoma candidum]|uniref:Uncharacterized protein n=2 Tax=Melastoma candidum TaxID=119954 RepID=A0ACB9RK50_9MYRT|nr:hypothetical protein MLD38_005709 [Melastoma candidum]